MSEPNPRAGQKRSTPPRGRDAAAKRGWVANLLVTAALVHPFIETISWRGAMYGGVGSPRSLVAHAYWWAEEAAFGPWPLPALAVGPPLLGAVLTLLVSAPRIRVRVAAATAALACLALLAALMEVGEDITFTWYKMVGPLALQAALLSAYAAALAWRLRPKKKTVPRPTEF